jgi:hypothetical protein
MRASTPGCWPAKLTGQLREKLETCTQDSFRINSKQSRPYSFFAGFWLALVGFFIVQCLQIIVQEGSFDLSVRLKFQIASLLY